MQRLLLTIIPLVVVSILLLGIITLTIAVSESGKALDDAAEQSLTNKNVQTKHAILDYFNFIQKQIVDKAEEQTTIQASKAFRQAFVEYPQQRNALSNPQHQSLIKYYTDDFAELYKQRNDTRLDNALQLVNDLSDTATLLQFDFIANSRFAIGEKDKLVDLNNATSYAQVHDQYHADFQRFLQRFGYYDIFLVDAQSGAITYSVYKELDFATNLKSGPYAGSGIAEAFNKAVKATKKAEVAVSQLTTYLPSYNAMAGFIAAPVFDGNRLISVLIFQIPLDEISSILTHDQQWVERGFGASGETYLINKDRLLINESRFFVEDKDAYLKAISSKYPTDAIAINDANTSVGIQKVDSIAAKAALTGETGFEEIVDYRDVSVYSYFSPLRIGDHVYGLIAEMDVAEAQSASVGVKNRLILWTTVLLILISIVATIVAFLVARKIVKPLNDVGDTCQQLASGKGDLTIQLKKSNIDEVDRIISPFNQFIIQIRDIISSVKEEAASLTTTAIQLESITDSSRNSTSLQRDETHMVASAVEQLSASIAEVSNSIATMHEEGERAKYRLSENNKKSALAADNIKQLVEHIRMASKVIASLKHDVNQITSVLNVITGIADQTNLLALNAAIEAARAGDAGRGFSVVADEVRALANRSQENTIEVSQIIEKMTTSSEQSVVTMQKAGGAAEQGIELVDGVSQAMREVTSLIEHVQEMSNTIAAAAEEQEATSHSVSENVSRISEMAEGIEKGAKQTNESAQELNKVANHLTSMIARFKTN
ncbi:methyl-accepting chemotaxis protein [Alteromonas ponticola]|nr:methyl-accepting chemotaxis protein [Alteromonas ponticola]